MEVVHTNVKDKAKVIEISPAKNAQEIQNEINEAIDLLDGLKVLNISSSVRSNGNLIVIIHHLEK